MRRLLKAALVVAVLLFGVVQYSKSQLIGESTYAGPPDAVWGYVIAVKLATPGVGEPLTPETTVKIDQDGYLTLLVPSGRTRTVEGQYAGKAWVLMACPKGCGESSGSLYGGDALGDPVIESLLALAELSETSEENVAAVRAPCDPEPIGSAEAGAV